MTVVENGEARGWQRLLIEPPRPESVRRLPKAYVLAIAAVCIGAFMGQLDASIVTLAFPSLARTFHASASAVSWVGLSYLLVLVGTLTAFGRLSDMVGRKLLYIYGFAVFVVGSALCAAAPDLATLVGFRVIQAVGAAMLQANSVAIIALAVPAGRLGRSLGIQGAAQALGLALGPSVGGLLLAAGGWRLIFLVNVPVGILGIVAALVFVPRSRHLSPRTPFDWAGFALFLPAVAALVFGVSRGNALGWASAAIVGSFAAAGALGVLFVLRERRCRAPMVDVRLFRRRSFSSGIVGAMLAFVVLFGVLVVVPYYLERAHGAGTVRTGFELMAMPVALGIVAPLSGRLADRIGTRLPAVAGMFISAAALLGLAAWRPDGLAFAGLLALLGAGAGLFTAPNNAGVMSSCPASQSGVASGLLNTSRGLGTALGLAAATTVFVAAGGDSGSAMQVAHAFSVTAVALAGVAVAAALAAGLGAEPGPLSPHREGAAAAVA
ncbi:MAG: DHA2 family efflux MFS transporter permease subunit [Acidimicrobiales bacterium]|nr:DHA2 family efflux MFS transporter permease subunit [Acidimicrobiales bacterium]